MNSKHAKGVAFQRLVKGPNYQAGPVSEDYVRRHKAKKSALDKMKEVRERISKTKGYHE